MMNALQDGTFRAGLTFPASGTTYLTTVENSGFDGDMKTELADKIEIALNALDSTDPCVRPLLAAMKALR